MNYREGSIGEFDKLLDQSEWNHKDKGALMHYWSISNSTVFIVLGEM